MISMRGFLLASVSALLAAYAPSTVAQETPHNLILFVADGLRSGIVTPQTAPALAAVRDQGVDFHNSHSLFPTLTTVNAAAIATGHRPGDTGDFGNTIDAGSPLPAPSGARIADLEDDVVLGLMNDRFGGDYLGHRTLLEAARAKGFNTAVIGKMGPAAIQDVTARDGKSTIVVDDATGYKDDQVIATSPDVLAAIKAAGLSGATPDRGLNGGSPMWNAQGVLVANVVQQNWMKDVATKVLLPKFKADGKPFVLVFWSRDPDGTQHGQGDSQDTLTPGINGPTTMKAIANASEDLGALRAALADLGLDKSTDVIVTADHGFSTNSRKSETSFAAKQSYMDVRPGAIPPGFLAIDLAHALGLKVFDPYLAPVEAGFHTRGSAFLGKNSEDPLLVIAANGGSDLIYLGAHADAALARQVVESLTGQDYTGAIFVDDSLGTMPGALPMSAIGLEGDARTPRPAIIVSFKSFTTGCADPETCGVEVADTGYQQGQGIHGSFSRADTHNFMAAIGPDFKSGFVDPAPISNADLAPTAARILGLDLGVGGKVPGRVIGEALTADGAIPPVASHVTKSEPAANGFTTVLDWQDAGGGPYFDAAGMPGRTLGLVQ